MNPIIAKLLAPATKLIIVPLFCLTALGMPKHFNIEEHKAGAYQGLTYKATVMEHPVSMGISSGRVITLVIQDTGKHVIADYEHEKWITLPETEQDGKLMINLINYLEKDMAQKHHHGFQGIDGSLF